MIQKWLKFTNWGKKYMKKQGRREREEERGRERERNDREINAFFVMVKGAYKNR